MRSSICCHDVVFAFTTIFSNSDAQKFECPAVNGSFADSIQCDKYYDCKDSIAEEVLCPDGLVFNKNLTRAGKCDQLFNVDCGNRTKFRKSTTLHHEHCDLFAFS